MMVIMAPSKAETDAWSIKKENMDRNKNLKAISIVQEVLDRQANPEGAIALRRALYMHLIIEAVLSERIHIIPAARFQQSLPKASTT